MRRKTGVFWITFCLVFILVIGSVSPITDFDDNDFEPKVTDLEPEKGNVFVAGTPHAPIVIDGDANFSDTALAESWFGDGSSGSPYIIDSYDIDLGGAAGHCISISNTLVNFTISNCNLTGASVSPGSGIYLENVTHGEIVRNIFDNNYFNIYLSDSHSVVIKKNTCPGSIHSINLGDSSSNNVITDNNCSSNGDKGIYLESGSHNNTVINNICSDNDEGIHIFVGTPYNTVSNNTCSRNVNGILIMSSYSTVTNNTCNSNSIGGIYLSASNYHTLANNSCSSNSYGIFIYDSSYNTVDDNICNSNAHGIYIDFFTQYNNFTKNICTDNTNGVSISGSDMVEFNSFYWNTFADNTYNGRDEGVSTTFDYNYWSEYTGSDVNGDGIGDTPHSDWVYDPHPLIYRPSLSWVQSPMDQTVEFNHVFRCELDILYDGPLTCSISDTTRFMIDNQGIVESSCILPIGDYALRINITNIYGYSITSTFYVRVTVDASNPPGWLTIPTDQSLLYGEEFDYQVMVVDPSGIDHWELNDTDHFTLTESYYAEGSTARITNVSVLVPGEYGLSIDVFDIYSNKLSAVITIFVNPPEQDTTPPTWVTLRIYQTIEYGEAFQVQVEAWDESSIDYWWLNDTIHFTLDGLGVITNATVLEPGIYRLEVRAYDPYENYCTAALVIIVLEPTTTTTTTPEGADPVLTLVLGAGIGGAAVVVVVIVFLRRKP